MVIPKSADLVLESVGFITYEHELEEETHNAHLNVSYCMISRLDLVMLTG